MTQVMNRVSCPTCGASRPPELATTTPRPPCPECGATGIGIQLGIADEIDIADELSIALSPTDQSRGWERRWAEAQRDLARLLKPRAETLSGDAIHAAHQELHSFFVDTYHIKDALKAEVASVPSSAIEGAITNDPDLALLADLANLNKHSQLTKPPRSGGKPIIGSARGVQAGSGEGGWRLHVEIRHLGMNLDGLDVARDAVAAWERHLKQWGLI